MRPTSDNPPAQGSLADLPARIAFAIPAAAVAIALLVADGPGFAAGVFAIGALALWEALRLLGLPPRLGVVAAIALALIAAVALAEGRDLLVAALAGAVALCGLAAMIEEPGRRTIAIAALTLAMVWVGLGVAHAIMLREFDHGAGLLLDVLLAVFVGDTAAHILGSLFGRTPLAPTISPNKTIEGLVAGIVTAVAVVAFVAAVGQPWLSLGHAAALGLAAGLAGPAGDLFESAVKREAGVKDSGGLLGPHGGVLDRVDAVLFAVVACYWVAVALL